MVDMQRLRWELGIVFLAASGAAYSAQQARRPAATSPACSKLEAQARELAIDLPKLRFINQELAWLAENLPNHATPLPQLDAYCGNERARSNVLQPIDAQLAELAPERRARAWTVETAPPALKLSEACSRLHATSFLGRLLLGSADEPADRLRKAGGVLRPLLHQAEITVSGEIRKHYELIQALQKAGCQV